MNELINQQRDQIAQLTAERDNAWQELREVRDAVNANAEESTADEVRRVAAQNASLAAQVENKDSLIFDTMMENKGLRSERDALAAHVEALREAYASYTESGFDETLSDAFEATPQHHLRELRAKTLQDVIHEVANKYDGSDTTSQWCVGANHVLVLFAKYAEQIRQEGK